MSELTTRSHPQRQHIQLTISSDGPCSQQPSSRARLGPMRCRLERIYERYVSGDSPQAPYDNSNITIAVRSSEVEVVVTASKKRKHLVSLTGSLNPKTIHTAHVNKGTGQHTKRSHAESLEVSSIDKHDGYAQSSE